MRKYFSTVIDEDNSAVVYAGEFEADDFEHAMRRCYAFGRLATRGILRITHLSEQTLISEGIAARQLLKLRERAA